MMNLYGKTFLTKTFIFLHVFLDLFTNHLAEDWMD